MDPAAGDLRGSRSGPKLLPVQRSRAVRAAARGAAGRAAGPRPGGAERRHRGHPAATTRRPTSWWRARPRGSRRRSSAACGSRSGRASRAGSPASAWRSSSPTSTTPTSSTRSCARRGSARCSGVPLIVEGDLIGVLHVGSLTPRTFGQADLAVLQLAAARAAPAIERASLFAELEHEHRVSMVLQRSLLPKRLVDVVGVGVAARYLPAREEVGRRLVRRDRASAGQGGRGDRRRGRPRDRGRRADGPAAHRASLLRDRGSRPGPHARARRPVRAVAQRARDGHRGLRRVRHVHVAGLLRDRGPSAAGRDLRRGGAGARGDAGAAARARSRTGAAPSTSSSSRAARCCSCTPTAWWSGVAIATQPGHRRAGHARCAAPGRREEACALAMAELVPHDGLRDDAAIVALQNSAVPAELHLRLPAQPKTLAHVRRVLRRWLIEPRGGRGGRGRGDDRGERGLRQRDRARLLARAGHLRAGRDRARTERSRSPCATRGAGARRGGRTAAAACRSWSRRWMTCRSTARRPGRRS